MADEVTPIPAGQEPAFEQWLRRNNVRDLDHPDSHYDYRGAFLAGLGRGGETGHFPDTFKQHGHPTFSVESRYSKGPGDGGSWDGERFMPGKPMSADDTVQQPPSPGYIPGKPAVGYGMTPGMHHNVMTMKDDYKLPENPLDVPEAPGAAPTAEAPAPTPSVSQMNTFQAPPGKRIVGWRVRDANGDVVSELHNVNTSGDRTKKIDAVGRALYDQAISQSDKESAQRARAYGLSLVDLVPPEEITKRMLSFYENDQRNLTNRSIQEEKSKRAALRGGGGPAGPSKADKFENQVDLDDAKLVEGVVNNEQAQSKVAALRDMESDLTKLEDMVSSKDPLAQRAAVMEYMKTLSGKQSTDVERRQLSNANGIIDALINNVSLWTTDPTLTKGYVQQFKNLVQTLRGTVAKRKAQIGKEASDRLTHQPRFAKKDQATKDSLGHYAQGVVTGDYGDAPQQTVDSDLLK